MYSNIYSRKEEKKREKKEIKRSCSFEIKNGYSFAYIVGNQLISRHRLFAPLRRKWTSLVEFPSRVSARTRADNTYMGRGTRGVKRSERRRTIWILSRGRESGSRQWRLVRTLRLSIELFSLSLSLPISLSFSVDATSQSALVSSDLSFIRGVPVRTIVRTSTVPLLVSASEL